MRLAIVYLSEHWITEFITAYGFNSKRNGQFIDIVGVPKDAKVHHCFQSPERRGFGVVLEHESFPDLPAGDLIQPVGGENGAVLLTMVPHPLELLDTAAELIEAQASSDTPETRDHWLADYKQYREHVERSPHTLCRDCGGTDGYHASYCKKQRQGG